MLDRGASQICRLERVAGCGIIGARELIEITQRSIRVRKRCLYDHERRRAARSEASQVMT